MSEEILGSAQHAAAPPIDSPAMPAQGKPAWVAKLKQFEKPNPGKAAVQLTDTLIPYLSLLALMYLTMLWKLPYWITFLLAFPAGALLVRIFIFFHDCGHGSYVASEFGRQVIGNVTGVLTFTSFADWRHAHGIHHSTSGNLDRRGVGDVWTMTLEEYKASTPFRRLRYRMFRNPFVMFGLGPFFTSVSQPKGTQQRVELEANPERRAHGPRDRGHHRSFGSPTSNIRSVGWGRRLPTRGLRRHPQLYDLLAAWLIQKHEQHEEMKEWVGGAWDTTGNSLEHTNLA